jgi:hypothetical protein
LPSTKVSFVLKLAGRRRRSALTVGLGIDRGVVLRLPIRR